MDIVCLGAGRIGAQVACEYALGGHTVTVVTPRPATARERVEAAFALVLRYGFAPAGVVAAARDRLSVHSEVPHEVLPSLVVEALPEDRELKRAELTAAGSAWPGATIATTTSSIGITELGQSAGVGDRIVATHYWNPPLLMPLVEVLGGRDAAPESVRSVERILRDLGKQPVVLTTEVPGFVWNRLQLALLRECLWLVGNGVATTAQIDEVVRDGLARRWRLLGPFETVSLGGAEVFNAIATNLFPVLSDARNGQFDPYVQRDPLELSVLAQRRDDGLAAELRAERGNE
jgi:3-hydroxybutyryl-CoA dehydrogenase